MTKTRFVLIALLVGALFAYFGNGYRPWRTTLNVEGQITPELLVEIKERQDQIRKINITSQGGDTKTAIEIGRIIREQGIVIQVSKYCISACAQWIMPSTKYLTVDPGTLVAFHQSASHFYKTLADSGEVKEAAAYQETANIEAEFYDDLGVSDSLLIDPFNMKDNICFLRASATGGEYAGIMYKYGLVVLRNSTYRNLTDQSVNGTWIESESEIQQMLAKRSSKNEFLSLVTEEKIGYQKSGKITLSECSQGQLQFLTEQRRKNGPRPTPF